MNLVQLKARVSRLPPPQAQSPEITDLRQHVDARLLGLRVDRWSFWQHWRELADYLLPRRYQWLITPNRANRGSPINQRIIDNTATVALRILAAGMMSGMTSPSSIWFRLTLDDPDLADAPAVKLWLDETARRMRTVFAESNFYTSLATLYQDLGAFGTGAMLMYEDFDDVIRCYNAALGEYYLANSPRQSVDTFYREFVRTTLQVAEEFGLENASQDVRSAIATGGAALTREGIIAHAIEPNNDYLPGYPGLKGMAWKECYWEWGKTSGFLRVRGFHESPIIAPRWDIVANDAYGRSPGMDALGDIKQLQVEQKRKSQAIDKMVNPPMIADPSLKNEPASLIPGGVTYVQQVANGVGFKPVYEVQPRIQEMMLDIKECQARIKSTMYEDLFLMIAQLDTVRSATEIAERKEEKLIQLGPVLERFENEALDPAVTRCFNIMLRAGLLPEIPGELRGQHVKTEYISMLAQAQKAAMTAGMERLIAFAGNMAAGIPDVLDNLDTDEAFDEYADMLGVPAKVVRPLAKVLQMRAQRAKQQQQQALLATTDAAVKGAKVLSETELGGGQNALSAMIGQDA